MDYTEPKTVKMIGKSLSIVLPSVVVRSLGIDLRSNFRFFAYQYNGKIVYSLTPPEFTTYYVKLKPRVQARRKGREYYVLTVPAVFARVLGIKEGSKVLLHYYGGPKIIVLEPLNE
jgi:antitoxin component of MazEF toxin-antitoxin module